MAVGDFIKFNQGDSESRLLLKPTYIDNVNNRTVTENTYYVFRFRLSSWLNLTLPVDGSVDLVIIEHWNTNRNGQIRIIEAGSPDIVETIGVGDRCIARFDGSAWSYDITRDVFDESRTLLPQFLAGNYDVTHVTPGIPSDYDAVVFHLEYDSSSTDEIDLKTTFYSPKLIVPPEGGVGVNVNIYAYDLKMDAFAWAYKFTIPSPKLPFWVIAEIPSPTQATALFYCPTNGKTIRVDGNGTEKQEFTITGLFDEESSGGLGSVIYQSDNAEINQGADFAVDAANAAVTLTVPTSFTEKFRVYDYKGSFETNACTVDFSNFTQGVVDMSHNFDDIEFFYIEGDGWYLWDRKINLRTRV